MNPRQEIINCLQGYFKEKAESLSVEMAFLYGSWARGFPRSNSDIDVAVVLSEEPSSENEAFERINTIAISLTSRLGLEVNIITIYKDFRLPMLYYNAIVQGIPIFIKDYDKYRDLRDKAIFQMEDFSIFGIRWQLQIARKNLERLTHA